MKKILSILSVILILGVGSSSAQFSAGYSNSGNVLTFKLRPVAATTTGFSTIEFFVRYPTSSPAFTYGPATVNNVDFPGMIGTGTSGSGAWEIEHDNPAFTIDGYHVDHIVYTAPAPVTTVNTYNANQEYNLVSFALSGDPTATVNFELVHQSTEASFYYSLTDQNGADLRPAAVTNYFFPTTSQAAGPGGSIIYYSALAVPLPVKFTGFNVLRRNSDAVITWQVENETALTGYYDIERSLNGVDFRKAYTVEARTNSTTRNSYELADLNLNAIRSGGIFYYRIRQVDKDGRIALTDIKNVRLTTKSLVLAVYPNPVKSSATLTLDLEQDANAVVTLHDASGKLVQNIQMQLFKGPNTRKINMASLAAGNYLLQVQTASEMQAMPVIKTN